MSQHSLTVTSNPSGLPFTLTKKISPPQQYSNAIWIQPYEDFLSKTQQEQQTIVQNMVAGGVKFVAVAGGMWRSSDAGVPSIAQWAGVDQWNQLKNAFHTYSNNQIKVLTWIYPAGPAVGEINLINLASPTVRQQCVDAAVNFVQLYNLDGFWDGLFEMGFDGSSVDFVTHSNALGIAMHNIGKISGTTLVSPFSAVYYDNGNYQAVYSGITEMDYIKVCLYDGWDIGNWDEPTLHSELNKALAASGTQLLAGIMIARTGGGYTCGEILGWIGHPTDSKFAGVALFNLLYMQSDDWPALQVWTI